MRKLHNRLSLELCKKSTHFERKTHKITRTGRVTSIRIMTMVIRNLEREVEIRESRKQQISKKKQITLKEIKKGVSRWFITELIFLLKLTIYNFEN